MKLLDVNARALTDLSLRFLPGMLERGRGFKAGKRLVIPRLIDRIIAGICILLPERALLRLIAALQRPHRQTGGR